MNTNSSNIKHFEDEELAWHRHVTPITEHYCEKVSQKDFRGKTLACWQHITLNTVPMLIALKQAGADIILGNCNVDSTNEAAADYLRAHGIEVHATKGMSQEKYLSNLKTVRDAEADYLCDMGGELISTYLDKTPAVKGALEATTSGLHQLEGKDVPFPVFDWNSIPLKDQLENRFHVGDGVWPVFAHLTTLSLFGRHVMVLGYGPVGKGVAERARSLGAIVAVFDPDPVRSIEAKHHGCDLMSLENALTWSDIIVTATGVEGVLSENELIQVQPGTILFNVGHSNREIDVDWLRTHPHQRMKAHIERFDLAKTHLYLLTQGSLLNLAAGLGGHGIDLFDHYTAVMLIGIAWMFENLPGGAEPGLQLYPAHLERKIATLSIQLSQQRGAL